MTKRFVGSNAGAGVLAGAASGALIWGVHAILEYTLFTLVRLSDGGTTLTSSFWQTNATLFIAYLFAGIISGVIGALLICVANKSRTADTRLVLVPPAFALTVAYGAHSVLGGVAGLLSLLIVAAIAVMHILLLIRPASFYSLRFLARPWPLSVLLLSRPIASQLFPRNLTVGRTGVVIVVIACAFLWYRSRNRSVPGYRALFMPSAITLFVSSVVLLVGTIIANEELPTLKAAKNRPAQALPNIILIVMDTVRADHLSTYGYERQTTPNLDRFAARANLYKNAFAVSDMTLATHASLFTGVYPEWHGAHYAPPHASFGLPLHEEHRTLPEILSDAGYTNLAVVANTGYINRHFGFAQGFDVFDARKPVMALDRERPYQLGHAVRKVLSFFFETAELDRSTRTAAEINSDAFQLLRDPAMAKRPFFLFLNYMEGHLPYLPPPELRDKYPGRDRRFTLNDCYALREKVLSLKRMPTDRERNHLISQYDAALMSLDAEIGNLFEKLRSLAVFDNSLIIITSDHGEAFGQKHLLEHSVGLYQDAIGIPLLIGFPGVRRAKTIHRSVSQVDVMPTILSTLSLPLPDRLQGHDIREDHGGDHRVIFSVSFQPYMSHYHRRLQRIERSIISGHEKLITSTAGKHELFDLASDSGENHNLYLKDNPNVRQLELALDEHVRAAPVRNSRTRRQPSVSKGTLDQLKSLGYVQ